MPAEMPPTTSDAFHGATCRFRGDAIQIRPTDLPPGFPPFPPPLLPPPLQLATIFRQPRKQALTLRARGGAFCARKGAEGRARGGALRRASRPQMHPMLCGGTSRRPPLTKAEAGWQARGKLAGIPAWIPTVKRSSISSCFPAAPARVFRAG